MSISIKNSKNRQAFEQPHNTNLNKYDFLQTVPLDAVGTSILLYNGYLVLVLLIYYIVDYHIFICVLLHLWAFKLQHLRM